MRAFKTVNDNYIEPISFTVPRRAETFQSDIFPPAIGTRPAMSAKEWLDGKTDIPAKIDLESVYEGTAPKEVAANYQPPAPVAAPASVVEPKKEEPKEEPKPAFRAPVSVNDQKSSIAAMANKYQDTEEEEPKKEEPSSFDEEVKPAHRAPLPIRSESKPAAPPVASPAPAPVKAASAPAPAPAAAASSDAATSLSEIKELIENQTKIISAQNDQIGLLTSEVESLKKRLGSGSQDQSERIRQLELELEEARS